MQRNSDRTCDPDSQGRTRIVHVTTAHDPRDIRIFRKQCRTLQREFGDVHLVAPFEEDFFEDGVSVHGVIRPRSRIMRVLVTLPKVASAARRLNADVYHLHDPDLLLVAPYLRRKARVLFDSHEDYPRDLLSRPYLQSAFGRWVVKLYSYVENLIFRRIDAVVTVNRSMTLRIREIQKTTVTIYNFPIASDLPEPIANRGLATKVVWLGLLNSARGVSTIAAAADRLPSGTIEVIGRCDDLQPDESGLTLLGTMAYKEAVNRAANYSAGLATFSANDFHKEMFPIKLFEYMLMGLPIVASRFPKWERLAGNARCAIFVDPDDPAEIAGAIKWIMDNPVAAREMGQRGRRLALENFSWSTEASKLIGLYRFLLGSGNEDCEIQDIDEFEMAGEET